MPLIEYDLSQATKLMICSGLSLISEHLLAPFTWIPQEALLWWRPLKVFPSLYQQFLHCASHSQCYRTHIPVWVVISNLLTVLVWIYFKTQVSILGNIFFHSWFSLCTEQGCAVGVLLLQHILVLLSLLLILASSIYWSL